jgi:PAS domain S-box-containing protein
MKQCRVFIIEEEVIDAMNIEERLAGMGYQLDGRAASGEQALACIEKKRPDLVLIDIHLQGTMDGIVVAGEIRKKFHIPVVFMNSYSGDSTFDYAKTTEPFGYILKPFDDRELRSAIEIALYKHQAETALRQSETRYRKLFEDATEGIALADPESGKIIDCNRAFSQMTGYEREELIGKSQSMLHQESEITDGAVSISFARHRNESAGMELLTSLVTKSGAIKQVKIKAHVIEIGHDKVMQAFFRDITEEFRYNDEREAALKLMSLLNSPCDTHELIRCLTDSIMEWTGCAAVGIRLRKGEDYPYFETRGFPLEFVEVENYLCLRNGKGQIECDSDGNPIYECMCGNIICGQFNPALPFFTEKGSFWSNCTTDLMASTSDVDRQAHTRNRCNREGYESVALFALRHGGHTLGLLQVNDQAKNRFTPELIRFLENASDQIAIALAQRQTQEELQVSEESYRVLVENAAEIIVVAQDGMLRFVNPQAEVVSGYSREELTTRPFAEFIYPEDLERSAINYQRLLKGEPIPENDEIRIVRKDGEIRWLYLKAQRISWNGSPAMLSFYTDVTKTRKTEEEKEKLQAQLFQAQKMESVGRLAGGIAHDFNNMISVININVETALERIEPETSLYRDLLDIQSAGMRSAELTRQLLAFARKQSINPKVLDLNDIIGSMMKMLLRLIGEDIHLAWNLSNDLWKVKVDPSQIDQIMANLAVNARDAISQNGQVVIETANFVMEDAFCRQHLGSVPGEYVMVSFSDNGSGMSDEILAHVFEPFFTTKEVGKGTGLGLATIYGIIKQNEGFIDVISTPGKGTTFNMYFPRLAGETNESTDGIHFRQNLAGTETILVVEDENMMRSLVCRVLRSLGYHVLEAANGNDALDAARRYEEKIHLVLTDVVMPGMNGKTLLSQLGAERQDFKAVYMSGYTENQDINDSDAGFLQKPFTVEILSKKIREMLDGI